MDLAFTMDASDSMQQYITAAKNNIANIVNKVKQEFNESKVRVAFVAYRDWPDKAKHFEILDFTENVDIFKKFVSQIQVSTDRSSIDGAEDVLGAIGRMIDLNWNAANRVSFHIGNIDNQCIRYFYIILYN